MDSKANFLLNALCLICIHPKAISDASFYILQPEYFMLKFADHSSPKLANFPQFHKWMTSKLSSRSFNSGSPEKSSSENRSFNFESSSNHEYDSSKPENNRSWDSSKHSSSQWTSQNRNGHIFESMESSNVECR